MEESEPTYCSAIGRRWLICVETNQNDGLFQFVTVQAFLESMICLRNAEQEGKPKLTLLVYNFQGFNGYFVLNQLYRKDMSPQQIVNRETKLLCLELTQLKIKFIDNLNLFSCLWQTSSKPFVCRRGQKVSSPLARQTRTPNVCGAFA